MAVFLRCQLNHELAEQNTRSYAPAVGRAKAISMEKNYVLSKLESEVDSVIEKFNQTSCDVPRVTAYLIERAKGDPRGVLAEAVELRSRTKDLREFLAKRLRLVSQQSPEGRLEAAETIKELSHDLRKSLGLKKRVKLRDAVDIQFIVGVPPVSVCVSGAMLLKWLSERMAARRIAVLTDLVKRNRFTDLSEEACHTLVTRCFKGTS